MASKQENAMENVTNTREYLSCDVLIAGGGFAGIAAALAAARAGRKTVLLEKQCALGGLAVSGLVTIYLPLCDGLGNQLSFGIAEELFRLSVRHGCQAKDATAWLAPDGDREERKRIRFETQFNPVLFALEAEALLLREGVRVFYDARVNGAQVRDGRICAVEAACEEGQVKIACGAAVDATGSAALLRACGEKTRAYTAGNCVAGWYYGIENGGLKLKMLGGAPGLAGTERNDTVPGERTALVGDSLEDINRFLMASHRMTLEEVTLRAEKEPGFKEPALMAMMPQLRMIRCLAGRRVMTEKEDGCTQADSVGMVGDWRRRGPRFEVPYSILYGQTENLFAAGRQVSCDDGMWDVLRVIPCCAVTGQAAGTAAALSSQGGARPMAETVQQALKASGQRLHFEEL